MSTYGQLAYVCTVYGVETRVLKIQNSPRRNIRKSIRTRKDKNTTVFYLDNKQTGRFLFL